ncbi:MAG TPA: NAD(P)-binding domain-containing protein, partial [Acidimicrobiales bacterium]|nr:NAD(P)-binding domain-containing protein [Acidimicrobiales bacterium]
MTRYGYIGLGDMGSAMAENLIANSDAVTVFDINPQAVEAAVSLGAHAASNPAEVAAASDVLSICVPAAEHISAVLEGPDGICDGAHDG